MKLRKPRKTNGQLICDPHALFHSPISPSPQVEVPSLSQRSRHKMQPPYWWPTSRRSPSWMGLVGLVGMVYRFFASKGIRRTHMDTMIFCSTWTWDPETTVTLTVCTGCPTSSKPGKMETTWNGCVWKWGTTHLFSFERENEWQPSSWY